MFVKLSDVQLSPGGRTQNVSYIFQGVFEGGLENVSKLTFEGILKTLPTKTTPVGRSATNFSTFKGRVPTNVSYILVWSPLKSSLKAVVIDQCCNISGKNWSHLSYSDWYKCLRSETQSSRFDPVCRQYALQAAIVLAEEWPGLTR